MFQRMTGKDRRALISISFIVSVCGVVGVDYVAGYGWAVFDALTCVSLIVLFTPVFMAIFYFADRLFYRMSLSRSPRSFDEAGVPSDVSDNPEAPEEKSGDLKSRSRIKEFIGSIIPDWNRKSIIFCCLVMALFWLPWFIANFPGSTYWDTYYQMYQVYPENHPIAIIPWEDVYDKTLTDAWLVDHHPIVTTLIYGAFGYVSDIATGNWMAGVCLFTIIQGSLTIFSFVLSLAYFRKIGCPIIFVFLSYVFLSIMPFISTWAMCMVKDSMFGLFLIGYFMMLVEAVRTDGRVFAKTRNIVLFCVLALLLCLTRKNGIFIVGAVTLIALFGISRRRWKSSSRIKVMTTFASSALLPLLVLCVIFPTMLFPAFNIENGGKQEILGPLLQQTARFVTDHPEDVSEEEKTAISKVIDYDRLAKDYEFNFQDSIKYRFNLDASDEDVANYLKVYALQGLRHPESYLASLASLAGYYVAPTAFINIRMVTVDTKMGDDNRKMLWNPEGLDAYRHALDDAYKSVGMTPVLDLPLLIVVYALWLPAALLYINIRRSLRCGLLFVPSVVLLAFCVIAPVYDARYVVPILYISPLLICSISLLMRKKAQDRIGGK